MDIRIRTTWSDPWVHYYSCYIDGEHIPISVMVGRFRSDVDAAHYLAEQFFAEINKDITKWI